jgi:uncharacterized protein GlcG (DUF336 family)
MSDLDPPFASQPAPLHLLEDDEDDESDGSLLASLLTIDGRGKGLGSMMDFEIIRELTTDDEPALSRSASPAKPSTALTLRTQHHRMARLVAEGRKLVDIALISGYSMGYVGQLCDRPEFQALVGHYAGLDEITRVDAIERLTALGLEATEIMQGRLAEKPDDFSNRELTEIIDLAVVRPHTAAMKATGAVAAASQPRQFQVVFRSAKPTEGGVAAGPIIEGEKATG